MIVAVRTIVNIILVILIILYLVLFSFLLFQNSDTISMSTDTMTPSIPKGSLLMYDSIKPSSLQIGDIVLFTPQDKPYSISRIVGVIYGNDDLIFRTKSDTSTWIDFDFKKESDVQGIITGQIPYVGFIVDLSDSFGGKLLLVTPPIAILAVLIILNRSILLQTKSK